MNDPKKARDLVTLALKEIENRWWPPVPQIYPAPRLPDWAQDDDDVQPLGYSVDIGPDPDGGDGWRIVRNGVTVGYAYQSFESYGPIAFSEEEPLPHDPRSYDM